MDNQHKQIKGYRDLSQDEIDGMNRLKALEQEVLDVLGATQPPEVDGRWNAIARTDLEKGFMAAIRAIAKPNT